MHARKTRGEWRTIVRAFERSGQTHETFCAARALNVGSFRGWLYRLRRDAAPGVELVPVEVISRAAAAPVIDGGAPIVVLVGDFELRVTPGTDPTYVARLVGEMRRG